MPDVTHGQLLFSLSLLLLLIQNAFSVLLECSEAHTLETARSNIKISPISIVKHALYVCFGTFFLFFVTVFLYVLTL